MHNVWLTTSMLHYQINKYVVRLLLGRTAMQRGGVALQQVMRVLNAETIHSIKVLQQADRDVETECVRTESNSACPPTHVRYGTKDSGNFLQLCKENFLMTLDLLFTSEKCGKTKIFSLEQPVMKPIKTLTSGPSASTEVQHACCRKGTDLPVWLARSPIAGCMMRQTFLHLTQ